MQLVRPKAVSRFPFLPLSHQEKDNGCRLSAIGLRPEGARLNDIDLYFAFTS